MGKWLQTAGVRMKGLFCYSYYHYEWEYLVCVSEHGDKLKERYKEIVYGDEPLVYSEE